MNLLAVSDKYLNKNINFIMNSIIIEYDMKDAGLSIIKYYKLLDKKTIKSLDRINKIILPDNPKHGKNIVNKKIGIMQINNHNLKEGLKTGFMEARDKFINLNNLDERNIISIKKDAFFVVGKVEHTIINEYIDFREKNIYTAYLLINNIEVYYNNGSMDIKQLGDEGLSEHKNYFLEFLKRFLKKAESFTREDTLKFLRLFIDKYKRLELDEGYYREFKAGGKYVYKDGVRESINFRKDLNELDISYNYDILIKLVTVIL